MRVCVVGGQSGATEALKENGCQLSGGHTTEGELALGFCVEGQAPNVKALWTKGGMKKGDVTHTHTKSA